MARSSAYHQLAGSKQAKKRPGPKGPCGDDVLIQHIRAMIMDYCFHGEGYRKVWARLRFEDIRTSPRRVLRLMRENSLLSHQRKSRHPGPKEHNGTIVPETIDAMWGTDMTRAYTLRDGWASVFVGVDHYSVECIGLHAAKNGTRFEALEPIRQGVKEVFGAFDKGIAKGLSLRHDCGSQYISDDFQDELSFLGIEASPAFVRSPQCNGSAERFIRTLKENLLWIRTFESVDDLCQALQEFKRQYNESWLIERHNYKTPKRVREQCLSTIKKAA